MDKLSLAITACAIALAPSLALADDDPIWVPGINAKIHQGQTVSTPNAATVQLFYGRVDAGTFNGKNTVAFHINKGTSLWLGIPVRCSTQIGDVQCPEAGGMIAAVQHSIDHGNPIVVALHPDAGDPSGFKYQTTSYTDSVCWQAVCGQPQLSVEVFDVWEVNETWKDNDYWDWH
jgi:hypothetical protein